MMTKTMLAQEWSMGIEQAIEAEAQAQAICMQTNDFARAYQAFVAKEKPVFEGVFGKKKQGARAMPDRSLSSTGRFSRTGTARWRSAGQWASAHLPVDHSDVDAACRGLVADLGQGGVPAAFGRGIWMCARCA
jgi:hypothetical protein